MTPCVQSHTVCIHYSGLPATVSLMIDCKMAKLSLFVFLIKSNENPKYYNGIPCIENTTIKTKSNWNLYSSIPIKIVRTVYAHMGIVTVMIAIWLRKVRV